ncbi:hypothetical protein [Actinomadura rubteroloni]|nr:hypothetical protein [Actinomadura rubteroloni]
MMQPHSTPPVVSPGRLVAAFFGGGAAAGAVAALFALAARFAIEATGAVLVPSAVHLIAAVVIGAVMAVAFVVAKARGPVAPVAAAAGALIAERAGWLAVEHLTGFTGRDITISLHLSMSDHDRYTMLSWASALLTALVAGGLTAAFALRGPTRVRPAYPVPQQPGPYNGRPPGQSWGA